jgi:hypothetical protein
MMLFRTLDNSRDFPELNTLYNFFIRRKLVLLSIAHGCIKLDTPTSMGTYDSKVRKHFIRRKNVLINMYFL